MGDNYILDTNVLPDIARGNEAAAEALKKHLQTGTQVTIAQAAYNEITDMPNNKALGAQYREMLAELNIKPAPPGSLADRLNLHADNVYHTPGKNQGSFKDYGKGANKNTPGDAFVAAQAKATGYKLLTFDEGMQKRARQFDVPLASESLTIKGVSGTEDPARARRLLGLAPIEINAQGVVTRRQPLGSPHGQTGTISTPNAPIHVGPSPKGEAKIGGIGLVFEGVNIVLEKINDKIQTKAVEEELAKHREAIQKARAAKPNMGVVIIVYYTQVVPREVSLITPGRRFSYLFWGQGRTMDEATLDARKGPMLTPGVAPDKPGSPTTEKELSDRTWLPPLQADSITSVKTPFPVTGVARFYMPTGNKVEIQNVKFDILEGFDDNDQVTREIPDKITPEFAVLQLPGEVKWYNVNGGHAVKVPLKNGKTANGNEITVVDLDPWSFGSATAVPIFPINDDAKAVFETTNATSHGGLLGHYINFGMVRWIRPANVHLLRFVEKKK